jgi:hypothetical protein
MRNRNICFRVRRMADADGLSMQYHAEPLPSMEGADHVESVQSDRELKSGRGSIIEVDRKSAPRLQGEGFCSY